MDREHRIGCHTGFLCSSQLVISLTRCATQTGPSIPYPNPQPPNFKKIQWENEGQCNSMGGIRERRKQEKKGKDRGNEMGTRLIFILPPGPYSLSTQPRVFPPPHTPPIPLFSPKFFPVFHPIPLGPRKQTDFGEGPRRPRPMIRWEGRDSGSLSGGWLVSHQTHCFDSHLERG